MSFTRPRRVRRSSRSSSMVSNSLASWANASSASGSSRSRTPVTRHGDLDVLALVLADLRHEGEGADVAGRGALERVVEAGQHPVGAELVAQRCGHEVLDRLAVLGAGDVEEQHVAGRRRALDRAQRAETPAQPVELLVDVGLGDLGGVDRDLDRVVRRQLEVGHDVHLGGERQRRGVLEVGDVDLGAAEQLDLVLAQRAVEVGVHGVAERLVEDGGTAHALVDDAVGHLALAEAGHLDLRRDPLVRGVERWLQLLERHLDGELHPGGREGLDSALHGDRYSWIGWLRGRTSRGVGQVGIVDRRTAMGVRCGRRPWTSTARSRGAGPRPQSGRGESNSRSPAPKAGALATTLRPAAPHRV